MADGRSQSAAQYLGDIRKFSWGSKTKIRPSLDGRPPQDSFSKRGLSIVFG
jgi:hypothetical protein